MSKPGIEITTRIPLDEDIVFENMAEKAAYIAELLLVMNRAENKWSSEDKTYQEHDDERLPKDWCEDIVCYAYWAKMMTRMESGEKLRKRLLQIAGLALHGVMSYDRLSGGVE
jgi:hypothetical protein